MSCRESVRAPSPQPPRTAPSRWRTGTRSCTNCAGTFGAGPIVDPFELPGEPMSDMKSTKAVTDATFDAEVLKSDKPVLVDFWAPWCGPCLQVAPVLAEIGAEHEELTVVKINIDENPKIASSYGVTSIPTLNVYSGGELVKSIVGAKPKPILLRELSNWLS